MILNIIYELLIPSYVSQLNFSLELISIFLIIFSIFIFYYGNAESAFYLLPSIIVLSIILIIVCHLVNDLIESSEEYKEYVKAHFETEICDPIKSNAENYKPKYEWGTQSEKYIKLMTEYNNCMEYYTKQNRVRE